MSNNLPVAVCTVCGKFAFDGSLINAQCSAHEKTKRCRGVFGSALNNTDWAHCNSCGGRGCAFCQNTGWQFIRK